MIIAVTIVFSDVLGFLGLIDRPLPRWKRSYIYIGSVCWIRLQSSALFKHLTAYLRGGYSLTSRFEWLGESSPLSDSLRSIVDVVDLFPSCNCRVQMKI